MAKVTITIQDGEEPNMEKGNHAVALGWQIMHFIPRQVENGEAYRFVHFLHHRTPSEASRTA